MLFTSALAYASEIPDGAEAAYCAVVWYLQRQTIWADRRQRLLWSGVFDPLQHIRIFTESTPMGTQQSWWRWVVW
jgi:hypothetical protein